MMVRTIPETQSILLKIARERWREGRTSHVIEHEVVLCEDGTTAMVYFYFHTYFVIERLMHGDQHLGVGDDEAVERFVDLLSHGVWADSRTR